MKERGIYYIITVFALCGTLTGGLLILKKNKTQQELLPEVCAEIGTSHNITTTTTQTLEQPAIATPQQITENEFFLQLRENTLYVYPKGQTSPIETYPMESAWLPEYDRILLENGVYAQNQAALRQLIEDYTS